MTARGTRGAKSRKAGGARKAEGARKAVRARRAEEADLDHGVLMNALPHPVLVIGPENAILFANAAAETFFDTSASQIARHGLDAFVPFASPFLSLIEQIRREGAPINAYGIDLATPRMPHAKLVDIYGGPLPETPDRLFVLFQRRTMAEMIERQLTHRAAARSVSGLAEMLAHEIKNPLSGIRGAAQLLETVLGDEDRALARLICSETDRICKLVDRMEVFGDERPLPNAAVNIHAVLHHVKQIAENGFARDVPIIEDYDPSLPAVPGDRDKLVQAFLNLVKNAAEALGGRGAGRRAGGRITLTTAFRPGVRLSLPGTGARVALPLMIAVEDNGPGIPDDLKPHLFDPFVTTKPGGSGLGLALVAKIIDDHGGVIECDSAEGRTVLRALMPMQEQPGAGDGDGDDDGIENGGPDAANPME